MLTAFFVSRELHAGIVDTMVVYAVEDEVETPGDCPQVLKSEVAQGKLAVQEDPRDDAVRERLDALVRGIFQRTRGSLDGVRQHYNGGNLRAGPRSRVAVICLGDRSVGVQFFRLPVKVRDQRRAVVLLDDVDDRFRQAIRT